MRGGGCGDISAGDEAAFNALPVLGLNDYHPSGVVGIVVRDRGFIDECCVHFDHLAADGGLRRTYPFAGFDCGARFTGLDRATDFLWRERNELTRHRCRHRSHTDFHPAVAEID